MPVEARKSGLKLSISPCDVKSSQGAAEVPTEPWKGGTFAVLERTICAEDDHDLQNRLESITDSTSPTVFSEPSRLTDTGTEIKTVSPTASTCTCKYYDLLIVQIDTAPETVTLCQLLQRFVKDTVPSNILTLENAELDKYGESVAAVARAVANGRLDPPTIPLMKKVELVVRIVNVVDMMKIQTGKTRAGVALICGHNSLYGGQLSQHCDIIHMCSSFGCGLVQFMGCQTLSARRGNLMEAFVGYKAIITAFDCKCTENSMMSSLVTASLPLILWSINALDADNVTVTNIRCIVKLAYAIQNSCSPQNGCVFCNDIDNDSTTCSLLLALEHQLKEKEIGQEFWGFLRLYTQLHQMTVCEHGNQTTWNLIEVLNNFGGGLTPTLETTGAVLKLLRDSCDYLQLSEICEVIDSIDDFVYYQCGRLSELPEPELVVLRYFAAIFLGHRGIDIGAHVVVDSMGYYMNQVTSKAMFQTLSVMCAMTFEYFYIDPTNQNWVLKDMRANNGVFTTKRSWSWTNKGVVADGWPILVGPLPFQQLFEDGITFPALWFRCDDLRNISADVATECQSAYGSLERSWEILVADLLSYASLYWENKSTRVEKGAFLFSIRDRLMLLLGGVNNRNPSEDMLKWLRLLRMGAHIPVSEIYFGQASIAGQFSTATTTGSATLELSNKQDIQKKNLMDVAAWLVARAVGDDEITVQVFFCNNTRKWVAINNRGYAVHCQAGVLPRRLLPHSPTVEERGRLNQTEVHGSGPYRETKLETIPPATIKIPDKFFYGPTSR